VWWWARPCWECNGNDLHQKGNGPVRNEEQSITQHLPRNYEKHENNGKKKMRVSNSSRTYNGELKFECQHPRWGSTWKSSWYLKNQQSPSDKSPKISAMIKKIFQILTKSSKKKKNLPQLLQKIIRVHSRSSLSNSLKPSGGTLSKILCPHTGGLNQHQSNGNFSLQV
jgi:hypothetical protein